MVKDIERKFLVENNEWRNHVKGIPTLIKQGYVSFCPETRVRYSSACTPTGEPTDIWDGKGFLAVLGNRDSSSSRDVFEYPIPPTEALHILAFCKHRVKKIRHKAGDNITVDEFLLSNGRLVLIEVKIYDNNEFAIPAWFGEEVTGQEQYNSAWIAQYGIRL